MDFRSKLLKVDQELGSEDVEALKFLCIDFISPRKLKEAQSAHAIFQLLINEDMLSAENHLLIVELLYIIRQYSLLRIFGCTKQHVQELVRTRCRVSTYRQMLYELSENITSDEHNSILFLLMDELPRGRATNMSTLELLVLLEKLDFFSENKLEKLEKVCENISLDLVKKIAEYKLKGGSASLHCQETSPKQSALQHQEPEEISSSSLPVSTQACNSEVSASLCERTGTVHYIPETENKAENITSHIGALSLDHIPQVAPATTDLPCYKMNCQSRGRCLVINNIDFMKLRIRKGSQKDANDLEIVFTWLGLEVETALNLNATGIIEKVKDYGNMNYANYDCFVCCILSHGESGQITGSDEKIISIRKITSYFTALNCPSLADKPKLFFIQACQGTKEQQGFSIEADAINPQNSEHQDVSLSESIPDEADFLLGMATVDGFCAFRHVQQGTWYIQALCKNLKELVPRRQDILSILTKVNEDVSRMSDPSGKKKQMPQPAYTLRKKLIFPVPRTATLCQRT